MWDGRVANLEDQALVPLHHTDEMAADTMGTIAELQAIPEYVELFDAAFGEGADSITQVNIVNALAAFERTLISDDSPFDRYLRDRDRQGQALELLGTPANLDMAEYVHRFLTDTATRLYADWAPTRAVKRRSDKGQFLNGVMLGFRAKLERERQRHEETGLVWVGDAGLEDFFAERGGDWPIVYSDRDEFSVAFGVAAVPETWVIDPSGVVRLRLISRVTAEQLGITLQQFREAYA